MCSAEPLSGAHLGWQRFSFRGVPPPSFFALLGGYPLRFRGGRPPLKLNDASGPP